MDNLSGVQANSLGSSSEITKSTSQNGAAKNALGLSMDDFLKILATSMSNPSMTGDGDSNSSGTDHISQMAQFATLQELNNMSTMMNNSLLLGQQQQAFNLMGKNVTVVDEQGNEKQGRVDKVNFTGGIAKLTVNGTEYEMGAIKEVREPKD
ncbi:flagellar basal body rod modification protein [Latilactobacillus curvatus]|uniref:flagellar hook capping FlgD N-terminal domain-containing protein n=1 Tax=Latilactobacillus curvatus TaxID=28038 RepID=UPI0020C77F4C|nr:flagellar hook capping FlgD N-terminal domain-containing protein [Latilactobacillus curvatus]MCP8847315.1 flagellar basal body rod modification protein [Latilactobacillus curvatus]MCP8864823.1 flagellar basal body rod modification protein [Latilactobacillus curvatus]MCP8873698.1 flagellar basal body rod modification protein [Latilactobacillus curvatus]MCP8875491.1 flagellar basal body rod modification protein [Latilactobacillus curvatus]MCP8879084.1 flagellar basal body rod modification pro